MLEQWVFILVFGIVALGTPVAAIIVGRVIGPRRPNPTQQSTYECGMQTVGDAQKQYKIQYYIFTLLFLAFDVEVVLLLPWALAYNQLPLFALFEGAFLIFILAVGLVYVWRKGALEWR
ncbi:MAG: NADH-quinone oxidoreductase subunit A [Anaerolineae bacterium]|nr:NADH-quinone oxidoreductase subunit A [Anaerolineae bacterium]